MKKILVAAVLALTALALAATALAAGPMELIFDSVRELFFDTYNVSIDGSAEFSLDGSLFKNVQTSYVQDESSSSWELALIGTQEDGETIENGFIIIANGQKLYVIEAIEPWVYKTGTSEPQTTIVRRSLRADVLLDILRLMAGQADELLGEGAVTTLSDGPEGLEVRLAIGENVPDAVNGALNLGIQFLAERYFGLDYDILRERDIRSMDSSVTVTQGILYCTKRYSVKEADITFRRNDQGHLDEITGTVSLYLDTGMDGVRVLDISFRMFVSAWGESTVPAFDPEQYSVTLAEDAMDIDSMDIPLAPSDFKAKWDIGTDDLYAWYNDLIERNGPFDSWPVDEQLRVSTILDEVGKNSDLLEYFFTPGWADSTCVAYDVTQWRYTGAEEAVVSRDEALQTARELLKSKYNYGSESDGWEERISLYTGHWACQDFASPWWVVRFYDGEEKKTEVWIDALDGISPEHDAAVPVSKAKEAFLVTDETLGGLPISEDMFTQEHVTTIYEDMTDRWYVIVESRRDSFWQIMFDDSTMETFEQFSSNG